MVEAWSGLVGIDTETTGLSPLTDRVRLIQVAVGEGVAMIDLFALSDPLADLAPLFAALAGRELIGHNLGFDLPFLARLGFVPGRVQDTMLASQVLEAGDRSARHGLKDVVARHLGRVIDKELAGKWPVRPAPAPADRLVRRPRTRRPLPAGETGDRGRRRRAFRCRCR